MRQVEDAADAAGISPQAVVANVGKAVNGGPQSGYGDSDGKTRSNEPAA